MVGTGKSQQILQSSKNLFTQEGNGQGHGEVPKVARRETETLSAFTHH